MPQIVTGQEAIKLGEFINDQLSVIAAPFINRFIDTPNRRIVFTEHFGKFNRHRLGIENIPAHQYRANTQHMIGGFTVDQRTLPGSVGVDHSPQRRPVTGGQFRRKEIAVGFQILVKLIFYHPRLYPYPTFLHIDFDDAAHVTGHINNNALIKRLTVGACTAAARGKNQRRKERF